MKTGIAMESFPGWLAAQLATLLQCSQYFLIGNSKFETHMFFFDGVWNETAKTIKIVMNTAVNLQGWGFYLEAPCFPKVFQQFMGVMHRKLSFNHFRWTMSRIDRAWYPTKIKRKSYEPEKVPVRVVHLHLCNLLGYGMNIVGTNFINNGLCGPNCSFCRLTDFT